jgi:hypothetical protein
VTLVTENIDTEWCCPPTSSMPNLMTNRHHPGVPDTDLFPTFGMPSLTPILMPALALATETLDRLLSVDVEHLVDTSMTRSLRLSP